MCAATVEVHNAPSTATGKKLEVALFGRKLQRSQTCPARAVDQVRPPQSNMACRFVHMLTTAACSCVVRTTTAPCGLLSRRSAKGHTLGDRAEPAQTGEFIPIRSAIAPLLLPVVCYSPLILQMPRCSQVRRGPRLVRLLLELSAGGASAPVLWRSPDGRARSSAALRAASAPQHLWTCYSTRNTRGGRRSSYPDSRGSEPEVSRSQCALAVRKGVCW